MFEYKQEENNHSLWVEKYRPNKLEDYVGNEHLKAKVEGYLESGDVPHLLLYGKAGTGKTTLAKLIVNSIDCDYIIINASDENNVVSKHCRFILTCNYVEKVIEPIQSRCQSFQIVPPTKKDVAIQMSKILKAENIEFDVKDLVPIIDSAYPDIRKVINTCQLNSNKGKLKVDVQNLLENDYKMKVVDILKSNDDKRNK